MTLPWKLVKCPSCCKTKSLIDSLHWLCIGAHISFSQLFCGNNIENVPARKFPFSESVDAKCRLKMNVRYK